MGVKEGYKQTEVGVIPEDWEVRTIVSICNIVAGGDLTTLDYSLIKTQDYKYPIYSNAISNSGLHSYSKTYQFEPDKITITARGSIGFAKHRNEKFCAIGRLLVFSKINNINLNYLAEHINHLITFAIESTGVPQLTAPQVSKYHVAFPPIIEEQKAIATALSDMDDLINSLKKLIEKKKNIKQGAMQELLTGKKRLEGFSGEWVEVRLGDICEYSNGTSLERFFNNLSGYKVVSIGNYSIENKYIDNGVRIEYGLKKEISKFLLKKNDLTMILNDKTSSGEIIGRVLLIESDNSYVFNQRTMRIRMFDDYLPLYFYYLFNSTHIRKETFNKSKPGTQIYINTSDVIDMALKIPTTIKEQTAIANILSDMDSEIETLQAKLDKYKAIKQGMMQELLTGRIRLLEGA